MRPIRAVGRASVTTVATITLTAVLVLLPTSAQEQDRRRASPAGSAATQVGGRYDERLGYVDGKWIDVRFGRPIKRGRDVFGPHDWADALNDGAPVWRAGANVSTVLTTEVPLIVADTTVEPGEYTLFIDLQPDTWTLVVSTWPAQASYDYENHDALWGAYEYTPDRDVLRAPMTLETLPRSFDQLSWQFLDMSDAGGRLALGWDRQMASVPFAIGP